MSDMECPYCGAGQEVCHDDGHGYSEEVKHKQECSECGKNFVFETTIVLYYEPSKADCLNGADHELVFRKSWPDEYSRMVCKHCDFARRATPEERAAAQEKGGAA
jgi:transposase-like protein